MAGIFDQWLTRPLLLTGFLLAPLLMRTPALAQAPLPMGDGIRGDYYEGTNFERFVLTRRDANINFNWGQQPPAPGLPAESFSVRWVAWLVPPISGKYTFQVTVDDGIRLWLSDRLLLNEWRGQPLSNYTTAVELRAGEPCRLRVDYCQYGLDTRVFVNWTPPNSQAATSESWRNLWGMTDETPKPEPIPTRFLFTSNPRPAPQPVVARPKPAPPKIPAASTPPALPTPLPPPRKRRTAVASPRRPTAPVTAAPALAVAPAPVAATRIVPADSGSIAPLARLAVGEAVTLPELYFEQGQTRLLAPTHAALDRLAAVLSAEPALRLEVQGHTDNVGNPELNRQLSQRRAEAVCRYLTAHGVATGQLRPVGYGGTQPVADNADPAQRPRNRRVVLRRL